MGQMVRLIDPSRAGVQIEALEPRGALGSSRGLLGWSGLGPGQGMLIRAKQVHTLGMAFTIDAVYLSRRGRVLQVETLAPGRVGPLVWSARWVLELADGEARRLGIHPGATLVPEET